SQFFHVSRRAKHQPARVAFMLPPPISTAFSRGGDLVQNSISALLPARCRVFSSSILMVTKARPVYARSRPSMDRYRRRLRPFPAKAGIATSESVSIRSVTRQALSVPASIQEATADMYWHHHHYTPAAMPTLGA